MDALAASLFVDDPTMLPARGTPPATTWSLLGALQPALVDIPRAERFTAACREPRTA